MAFKLQKFATVPFKGWDSKITKLVHIESLGYSCPNVLSDMLTRVFARDFGQTIFNQLNKIPLKTFDDDKEYFWEILGESRRNIPLVECRTLDGESVTGKSNINVGANGEKFYLVFDEPYFFRGEEIMGNMNEIYPIRLPNDAVREGTRFVYLAECADGSEIGIPVGRLQPGERFSYSFAPIERGLSKDVGGVRHATNMKMRNEFTMIRLHDEVSGDVYDAKIAIGAPLTMRNNGRVEKAEGVWMHYWDYKFSKTWEEYKNNVIYYSKSNRKSNGEYQNFGVSGEVIKKGDGIRVQLDRGNVIYYNKFSLKLLEEALLKISAAKIELGAGRHFTLHTGEYGAKLFSDAVRNAMSGWTEFEFNGDALGVVKKVSSPLHETSLSAGAQFTRYSAPMGVVVDVVVDALNDDPVTNKMTLENGMLASSATFEVWDMGSIDTPNVFRCGVKGQPTDARSYSWGPRNPYTGQWGNPHRSYDIDKAEVSVMGTFGAAVRDCTRVFVMKPDVLMQ